MRKAVTVPAVVASLLAVAPVGLSVAPSPYPATISLQRGLAMSSAVRARPWGTPIPATQVRWVSKRSSGYGAEWGVWKQDGGPAEFPVRRVDGRARWFAAGPLLASDWAGGGVFYVDRTIPEGPSSAVFVSGAVIDVTVDAGRQWYQSVQPADDWSITAHPRVGGEIAIRVGPASYASLPARGFAVYTLDLARSRWVRVADSPA